MALQDEVLGKSSGAGKNVATGLSSNEDSACRRPDLFRLGVVVGLRCVAGWSSRWRKGRKAFRVRTSSLIGFLDQVVVFSSRTTAGCRILLPGVADLVRGRMGFSNGAFQWLRSLCSGCSPRFGRFESNSSGAFRAVSSVASQKHWEQARIGRHHFLVRLSRNAICVSRANRAVRDSS